MIIHEGLVAYGMMGLDVVCPIAGGLHVPWLYSNIKKAN